MPLIRLSRRERASLHMILDRPRQAGEIPADHEEKFVNYALAHKRVLLLYITPLGHIELLRQRFRGMKLPAPHLLPAFAAPPARLCSPVFRTAHD